MPIMVNVGNSYKEVTAILDKNGNAIDTVYAQNGSPVYSAWKSMTLTGVPPLPFKAKGTPLISWSMLGNGSQTGTPTPDAPIQPTFCGKRTANLFPLDATKLHVGRIENDGTIDYEVGTITVGADSISYQSGVAWRGFYTDYIEVAGIEALTMSPLTSTIALSCNCYDANDDFIGKASAVSTATYRIFNLFEGTVKVRISITGSSTQYTITNPMLNLGSTALPYEPYGWAEKITCGGQTTPVYLGAVQTVRRVKKLVLDGTENWRISTGWKNTATSVFYVNVDDIIHISADNAVFVYSNAFAAVTRNKLYNGDSDMVAKTGSVALTIRISDSIATTVIDFKAYLAQQYAAGTPATVWYVLAESQTAIINEPLCKIGTYADELHSEDAAVTIPTVKGNNTLTVDTVLQPSSATITYRGRPINSI